MRCKLTPDYVHPLFSLLCHREVSIRGMAVDAIATSIIYVCLVIYLFVCLFICLFIYLFVCLFICLFICLFVCFLICLFMFNHISIYYLFNYI
jgi:hypothetical protein